MYVYTTTVFALDDLSYNFNTYYGYLCNIHREISIYLYTYISDVAPIMLKYELKLGTQAKIAQLKSFMINRVNILIQQDLSEGLARQKPLIRLSSSTITHK